MHIDCKIRTIKYKKSNKSWYSKVSRKFNNFLVEKLLKIFKAFA